MLCTLCVFAGHALFVCPLKHVKPTKHTSGQMYINELYQWNMGDGDCHSKCRCNYNTIIIGIRQWDSEEIRIRLFFLKYSWISLPYKCLSINLQAIMRRMIRPFKVHFFKVSSKYASYTHDIIIMLNTSIRIGIRKTELELLWYKHVSHVCGKCVINMALSFFTSKASQLPKTWLMQKD